MRQEIFEFVYRPVTDETAGTQTQGEASKQSQSKLGSMTSAVKIENQVPTKLTDENAVRS